MSNFHRSLFCWPLELAEGNLTFCMADKFLSAITLNVLSNNTWQCSAMKDNSAEAGYHGRIQGQVTPHLALAWEKVHHLYQNTSYSNKGRAKQAGSLRPKCAIRWEDNVEGNEREEEWRIRVIFGEIWKSKRRIVKKPYLVPACSPTAVGIMQMNHSSRFPW